MPDVYHNRPGSLNNAFKSIAENNISHLKQSIPLVLQVL